MRRLGQYIIILFLLLSSMIAGAQNRNNLIATKKGLVLLIDLNSPNNDIDTILKRAAIKGMNIQRLKAGDFKPMGKDGWVLVKHQGNILQFNLPEKELKENPQETPFVITGDIIKKGNSSPGYMDNANYGINRYSTASVYELPSGLTRFILPGYLKCRRLFLSGGFNEWSTLKGLMTKTATGWVIDIKLQPGAWMYKFIADGHVKFTKGKNGSTARAIPIQFTISTIIPLGCMALLLHIKLLLQVVLTNGTTTNYNLQKKAIPGNARFICAMACILTAL